MSTTFSKKYKVIQKIGEGSFSEVLKCQDRDTGTFYAAKRLKRIYQSMNEILDSPEVIAMRKISRHANILYMIESHYDPLPGKVTLIFELMDMSLYDLIRSRKGRVLIEQKVKSYIYQLLKGLDHLHKHGIFHRDIKPENILVKGETVKLADLGSIRGIYSRPPYTEYISTRWYRSPECLLTTGYYGPKMDIWALGCVYYELLTLKPLFPGCNEIDQIARIHTVLGTPHARLIAKFRRHKSKNCEYSFVNKSGTGFSTLLPHVSEAGKELLKMMLMYDPEVRSNVKRLLESRYFNSLREHESPRQPIAFPHSTSSPEVSQWRNPMLLSYITSEKRRRCKPLSTRRPKITDETISKVPRIVASSPNARPIATSKSSISKIGASERGDGAMVVLNDLRGQREKIWRRNVYSTRTERTKDSPRSAYSTRLPIIKYNSGKMEETGDSTRKNASKRNYSSVSSHYNLRGSNTCANVARKASEINRPTYLPEIVLKPEKRKTSVSVMSTPQSTKNEEGKRSTRLSTIKETKLPAIHNRSPNIKSPAKKMAKHEASADTSHANKKATSVKHLRGK